MSKNQVFQKRYQTLNQQQKIAVDTLDGPVMVVAGPGTGKTELLAMRVANILDKTDTLPNNILCLTFTDSGVVSMKRRLLEIIGKTAYDVAVHTFHSFGAEIIGQNPDFFYNGSNFKPTDEVKKYEIIHSILAQLDHKNVLSKKRMDINEFVYQRDCSNFISNFKRSGLSIATVKDTIKHNELALDELEPIMNTLFTNRISNQTLVQAENLKPLLETKLTDPNIKPTDLARIISRSFLDSLAEALAGDKPSTKPLTAWKGQWLTNNAEGEKIFKDRQRHKLLTCLLDFYQRYAQATLEAGIFDFDDMIIEVIKALQDNYDLRLNLQEKYQYILVDEFQDTNGSQMKIIDLLGDNELFEGKPNIMVVGDDDQAIYKFQGAEISNILDFKKKYPAVKVVTLTENYRSAVPILDRSRDLITQAEIRLETSLQEVNKILHSHGEKTGEVAIYQANTEVEEKHWLANDIKQLIVNGVAPEDVAILVRENKEIEPVVAHLKQQGIQASYAKQADALKQEIIVFLEKLAQIIINLADNRLDDANYQLASLLSHPVWQINQKLFWETSITASRQQSTWLEIMAQNPTLQPVAEWLLELASLVDHQPLEKMIDLLVGNPKQSTIELQATFVNPIFNYFFGETQLQKNPGIYLLYLESLRNIRDRVKQYYDIKTPTLRDFIQYIQLLKKLDMAINLVDPDTEEAGKVKVMTAHKAKGQEFKIVYIPNAVDNKWGSKSKKNSGKISYPENLPLQVVGDGDDERIRLFYVAMTRAKEQLKISYSQKSLADKSLFLANFLVDDTVSPINIPALDKTEALINALEVDWYQPVLDLSPDSLAEVLASRLSNYHLTVTSLQSFLNVAYDGASHFLTNNLLRFPQAKSAKAGYGTAMHSAIQFIHLYFIRHQVAPSEEQVIEKFVAELKKEQLAKSDFELLEQQGRETLHLFLADELNRLNPHQKTEVNFNQEDCVVGEAKITGKIDLLTLDPHQKTASIADYKTGEAFYDWEKGSGNVAKKQYHYRQQLLFYTLLLKKSRSFSQYAVTETAIQFVEPDQQDRIIRLVTHIESSEITRLELLVQAVWHKIVNLDFPDTTKYPKTVNGIKQLEDDLIKEFQSNQQSNVID